MCVNIIYVCICLYCVICLILYYRSLLICTNKEFMKNYNFRNPSRLLPKIKHEFPRQSLRYRLIVTLNETSDDILEMATTQSQKCFTKFIRERIVADYSYTCNLVICHVCDGR